MKSLFARVVNPENCGRIVFLTSLLIIFLFGVNFNKEVIPNTILLFGISFILIFTLIAYSAKIYWLFYFWAQYTITRKFGEILKIAFFSILLSIIVYPIIKVTYILGLN